MTLPNQLYEAVPVTPETMPPGFNGTEWSISVLAIDNNTIYKIECYGYFNLNTGIFYSHHSEVIPDFTPTHYLRPYSPEELVRYVAEKIENHVWLAGKYGEPLDKTFTDNLVKEVCK